MHQTRRDVLRAGAGIVLAGSAGGCLQRLGLDDPVDADGYAAFFALHDWAQQVGGDAMEFANPVETGRIGHGWSPDVDLTPKIAETEVFVYVDTPEFAWAQNIAATLEREYEGVATVDLFEGLDDHLLDAGSDHGDGDVDHDDGEEDTDSGHEDEDGEDDHEAVENDHDDHDHADDLDHDPHAWIDPVLAGEMVTTLGEELAAIAPDNGDRYRSNAETYVDRLDDVHEELESLVATAELDVVVLAGHDSYRYLGSRYDLGFETPVGISPDASVSPADITRLTTVVDDHGIETVLYDRFEATAESHPQMVDVILEETGAEHAAPLTPLSGTTPEWEEAGWGWIEQMREVNVPALEQALNPS